MDKNYDNVRKKIDEIKSKVDIVDFVNSYLSLSRKGKNYAALCPFHAEDTPSFYIFPETQTFHCFGCGAHGDVITFLEKYEQISFLEALKKIAQYAGVEIDLTKKEIPEEISLNEEVSKLYTENLLNLPSYHEVWKYLKNRKISKDLAKEFELGFATGSDVKKVLERELIDTTIAIKAGLIHNEGNEFFHNRLIIPIRDNDGLLVGFSGRIIKEEENIPKYLNTSENNYFKKSKILYMYYKNKKFIKENDFAILVEGYFDVISMYRLGFKNVVGILGSSFTKDHAVGLVKSTNKVVSMFDMDEAGKKATLSTIDILYPKDFQIAVSTYPAKDPDELTKKHDEKYIAELLKSSYKFYEFIVDYYSQKYDLNNDFALEKYLKDMAIWYRKFEKSGRISYLESFIEKIADKTKKSTIYVQKILERMSKVVNVNFSANNESNIKPKDSVYVEKDIKYDIVKSYLYLWVKHPQYREILQNYFHEEDFNYAVLEEFFSLIAQKQDIGFLLENSSEELSKLIVEVWKIEYYFNPDRILSSLKESIEREKIIKQIEELKEKLHQTTNLSEKTEITSQIVKLYSKLKVIN
ncbi:DNA primase [Petrotoga sp. 9PW.55.5.1]|uniref:DNA primase n=1 Tax=Petrotoga sp. 9PW.55.5.1 TaxID=1308979 RepID=UPI000DD64357|nr:DNA primase [Petrotoga sp. 9PW.55.5.1]